MKKMAKISSIIITAVLTFSNSIKLIPSDSDLGSLLQNIKTYWESYKSLVNIITVIILILGSFVIVNLIIELRSEPTKHSFKKGSKKLYNFFAKWYSQEGNLSIICDDMDWISNEKNKKILEVLSKKSKAGELFLFLKNKVSKNAILLMNEGAKVFDVSDEIIANYSFSCLSFMGNYSAIIVRDKRNDVNDTIKFNEINSTYVSGLLNALIKEKTEK